MSVIRTVPVDLVLVLARSCVVATDDEVSGAKVFANDGVPNGFTRTGHAHGKGQQGQSSKAVGVGLDDGFVDADASEGVNVTG